MRREKLILELTNVINNREGTDLTVDQVGHYIGSDMSDETLYDWLEDSKLDFSISVTADDVLSLWDECED